MIEVLLVGKKANGRKAIIDEDDFELINKYRWYLDPHGYAQARIKGRNTKMHRLILNAEKGTEIDHKNMNRLDNQKSNLRFVNRSQNMMNKPKQSNNTSGYKGVYWNKSYKRWIVRLGREYTAAHTDLIEAAKLYNREAKKRFGDIAKLNIIPNEYKNIVIFGASGFLGSFLIGRLISLGYKNILAIARGETNLVALKEKYNNIDILIGDISDKWIVKKAMTNADGVYILSALKHVGLAEINVRSCINTNITGTMNIIEESLITKPEFVLFTSTDKSSQPTGVYGCTKKIGEMLMSEAERKNPETKYFVVRYGNVWASNGSLATKWKPKMQKGEEVILTDPRASRFFFTVEEAIDLIFECLKNATNANPYISKMKAISMKKVLEACQDVYGKCPVKIIGLQNGENKYETLDGIKYSNKVEQYTKQEFKDKFLK